MLLGNSTDCQLLYFPEQLGDRASPVDERDKKRSNSLTCSSWFCCLDMGTSKTVRTTDVTWLGAHTTKHMEPEGQSPISLVSCIA